MILPWDGWLSVVCLVVLGSLSMLAIFTPAFKDNPAQGIGLSAFAAACFLALPGKFSNPSTPVQLLIAQGGLTLYALGTAWKTYRHATHAPRTRARYEWVLLVLVVAGLLWVSLPVVVGGAELVARDGNSATVRLWGSRIRGGECSYKRVHAETAKAGSHKYQDRTIMRIDRPEEGKQRAVGSYDFGLWMVVPIEPTDRRLRIGVEHECGGRDTTSTLATLEL